jgi:protein-S-isoprenylcysteine O-methyltransferase Ste14
VAGLAFAAMLLGAAGRLAWPAAWAFLILFFAISQLMVVRLARRDPALLAERLKPPVQREQPLWDRIFMSVLVMFWFGWFLVIGLDARFGWSAMPLSLRAAGAVLFVAGYAIVIRVLDENPFLAPVVKIQRERQHRVISTGPYAVVRHPMYAGMCLMVAGIGLFLGSWIGLAGAFAISLAAAWRAVREERELETGLDGYRDYEARVRWRLIPPFW